MVNGKAKYWSTTQKNVCNIQFNGFLWKVKGILGNGNL